MAAKAEMSDDEGVISIREAIQAEEILEEETAAVLGDVDDNNCTYSKGYVKRQPLYACYTCTANKGILAGVCYACSIHCHDGHILYELYTKRNFRCDCGNDLFSSTQCTLDQKKDKLNLKNTYNQNYKGLYCVCNRPYPDEECPEENQDQMIQCNICEDWFHATHLGKCLPDNDRFTEMTCDSCVRKHSFLSIYSPIVDVTYDSKVDVESLPTDLVTSNKSVDKDEPKLSVSNTSISCAEEKEGATIDLINNDGAIARKRKASDDLCTDSNVKKDAIDTCKLKRLQEKYKDIKCDISVMYFRDNWRSELCTCGDCKCLYKSHAVEFLLDPEDSIHVYEERSKAKYECQRHAGINELDTRIDNLSYDQKCHLAYGINDFKNNLTEFLKDLASKNKVVEPGDIQDFFNMQEEKRKKLRTTLLR
ncbi:uncharacterized protein TRIADDRAFT_57203 [Trichoplax adhaerens]|uniref:UBR-type domain-containing protein n=1 Tax=Trichoplax adhaerens TaxID=10228 RepID=B3RYT0_TRIAD|nr:hypothetical protein TRIADDRAFT_57203 [Trichoplax adhaerens]EDV23722.1 hypothetical protein TRIADDRAFT_57203 [Trichoplax adhaerens]|eukprot:XP_002113248.1 hypothetical protein TRIADDRAFT_57203 [Trichoplax adhaerens]